MKKTLITAALLLAGSSVALAMPPGYQSEQFQGKGPSQAPLPMPVKGKAPLPVQDQGKVPMPVQDQGKAPLPVQDQGKAPLPVQDQGKAPLPVQTQGKAPLPIPDQIQGKGPLQGQYQQQGKPYFQGKKKHGRHHRRGHRGLGYYNTNCPAGSWDVFSDGSYCEWEAP